MLVRFCEQVLIGFRVHAPGEIVELPDDAAEQLVRDGVAVKVEPVREATNPAARGARRATKRGRREA